MATQVKRLYIPPMQRRSIAKHATDEKHFAEGMNFYKLFWVFIIGSVIGCLVETVFILVLRGQYQCRASLMHGPFNLVYGIGALILYLGLHKINHKKKLHVFIFGAIAGTAVEYICSLVQEVAFGSVSWDYSNLPLNIGGRVCLLFGVFWGLLALAWVMFLQPAFDKVIAKIPNAIGRPVTWILCAFMVFNIVISIAAVSRWMGRMDGIPAPSTLAMLLDNFYPDSLMQHNFGEMIFLT